MEERRRDAQEMERERDVDYIICLLPQRSDGRQPDPGQVEVNGKGLLGSDGRRGFVRWR